jgi:hypothetical protein
MRRNLILQAAWVSWCVAATASLYGQQQQVIAHVLDLKGEWRLDATGASVVAGEGLIAGAKITAGSNRQGDTITIVRDEDLSRELVACDSSATNPCRSPIVVQGGTSGVSSGLSQLKGIVQAAIAVLLDNPPAIQSHYALTLTRGRETIQESEGVVALDPTEEIVLPPAPPEMRAGRYTFSIARAEEPSSATEQTGMLTSEGMWRPLPLKASGLYEIAIVNADGDQVANMMLLVAPATRYQAMRDEFETMKRRAATWTGPGAREDEHLFLRAFLLSSSRSL